MIPIFNVFVIIFISEAIKILGKVFGLEFLEKVVQCLNI